MSTIKKNKENVVDYSYVVDYVYAEQTLKSLSPDLICSVCQDPLRCPVIHIKCGHMFCGGCMARVTKCPQCRGPTKNQLSVAIPRIVTNQLNDLGVICPECKNTFARSALVYHMAKCARGM